VAGVVLEEVTDLEEVWPVLTDLFLTFEDDNRSFLERRLRPDWAQRWHVALAAGDGRLLLLARAAGYPNARVVRDCGRFDEAFSYVPDAFLRAEYRGQGTGSAMLARAESWCRDRGADAVRPDVWAANQLGLRFWQRSGYDVQSLTMKKTLVDIRA
jgi:GNAT superfamily N-acetyltransferase